MAKSVKPAADTSEKGYVVATAPRTGDAFFSWLTSDPFERVADLQWPQSVPMFAHMENDDTRIGSLLNVVSTPILDTTKRIDPNGASEEVAEFVSRNLNLPLVGEDKVRKPGRRRDRFSYEQHLAEAVSPTNQFGHALFEQVYRPPSDDPDGKGRAWIRKLAPRPQWTIQKFNVAADGGLESITQMAPAATGSVVYGIGPTDIPISRLVVYARDKRPGRWMGKSLIRSAYKHWVLKNQLMRVQAAAAQRNGMGVPAGTASTDDPQEIEAMRQLASAYQVGMGSGVGLANGQTLELLGVKGTVLDVQTMLAFHDKMMALEPIAQFLNLDRGGSYALATVQQDPFTLAENAMLQFFIRVANEHIVEDLVDINWGPDTPAPLIVADPIGTGVESLGALLKMLVDAELLSPDVLVEQTLRQRLSLPAKIEGPADQPADPASDVPPAADTPPVPAPAPATPAQPVQSRRGSRRRKPPSGA